jgi:hypothetical protein
LLPLCAKKTHIYCSSQTQATIIFAQSELMWAEIKKDVELAVPFSAGGRKELKQFALFFFFQRAR